MELVELKSVWQLINADIKEKDFVDDKILIDTIHQKSATEVSNIRMALQLKLIIGGVVTVFGLGLLVGMFIAPQKFNTLDFIFSEIETIIFYCTLITSLSAMLWFNFQAYKKVAAAENQTLPLKNALEMVIGGMKNAMKFNIYSDALMTPIILTWLLYSYAYRGDDFSWDGRIFIIALAPMVTGILAFLLQRYLQKLKFGNYVKRLEHYLKELE